MEGSPDVYEIAEVIQTNISLLRRRFRRSLVDGELTMPERSALARIEYEGPTTAAALAKLEQISAQSMGATLNELESRGLLRRHADPEDGRKTILSLTESGAETLRNRRNARTVQLAEALSSGFTHSELVALMAASPLLERLAQRI
jgi:DNA-binding MarR family transcriptional regulator